MRKINPAQLVIGLFLLCVVQTPTAYSAQVGAQIVLLIGNAEKRPNEDAEWLSAAMRDELMGGSFIRTLANSQAGLLLANRTQIRLNQNSQLQIKSVAETAAWKASTVKLNEGRAWSQARPRPRPRGAPPSVAAAVTMETASATMSIRGTDWEVEILPDGSTQLAVVSGLVEMFNDHGSIQVGNGEAAIAEPGKAPVKLTLINPVDRVQWVSAWKPTPEQWLGDDATRFSGVVNRINRGDYSGALAELQPLAAADVISALLAADLLIYQGDIDEAASLLAGHANEGRGDARAVILLAHAWARSNRAQDAARLLATAIASEPNNVALRLARGDIAVLEGDADTARLSYRAAADLAPENADAWYGLGLIASEQEHVREARKLLNRTLGLNPDHTKAAAELAAVETFAGELNKAAARYETLLAAHPDNYPALTGRGINHLKAGDADLALDDFLRAGVIEPSYSRAWLYSGVAFYQDNVRDRAEQAFVKASSLDELDPVPYLMRSIVHADALEYGPGLQAARESHRRMPYLKSLNQIANDQRGSANLGNAIARFGMEEWATNYAYDSYSPFWAGSPLFLSGRYTNLFQKNSELYKGFMTDPTVFGASNRNSSLVREPGNYARLDGKYRRTDWDQYHGVATVNGLSVASMPIAYFVRGDLTTLDNRPSNTDADADSVTVGLGFKPRHDVSLFLFGFDRHIDTDLKNQDIFTEGDLNTDETRYDAGLNFKVNSRNQVWLKAGHDKQEHELDSEVFSPQVTNPLDQALDRLASIALESELSSPAPSPRLVELWQTILDNDIVLPNGTTFNDPKFKVNEYQFRHSFETNRILWNWGIEYAERDQRASLESSFPENPETDIDNFDGPALETFSGDDIRLKSKEIYASAEIPIGDRLTGTLQLSYVDSDIERDRSNLQVLSIFGRETLDTAAEDKQDDINPRIGLLWRPSDAHEFRLVGQRWRRPAATATLQDVDTLGVVVNSELTASGGEYERIRFQYDAEHFNDLFIQAFVDHERIDNGLMGLRGPATSFDLEALRDLLDDRGHFSPISDYERSTPNESLFEKGKLTTVGLSSNWLVNDGISLSARYLWRDTKLTAQDPSIAGALQCVRSTGAGNVGFSPSDLPMLPDHYLLLRANFVLPNRVLLGTSAAYRSKRYSAAGRCEDIDSGTAFGVNLYWETSDKRASVEFAIQNILTDKSASLHPDEEYLLRFSYRF